MPSRQSQNFCFTVNNWNENHIDELDDLSCHAAEYIVAGKEVAPTTQTPHLQGFIRFKEKMTLTRAIGLIPQGFHVIMCKGNAQQNIAYCTKEDPNPFEWGKKPKTQGSGQKERWSKSRQLAREGKFEEIDDELYTKYIHHYKAIYAESQPNPQPLENMDHLWIYGETGTGKSHSVATKYPQRYIKNLNKWWDGYTDQEVVHIDEIDPSHQFLSSFIKKWADKWPFNAEVKGSSKQLRPPKVIVTSNYSIDEMNFPPADAPAIKRRFREIKKEKGQDIII